MSPSARGDIFFTSYQNPDSLTECLFNILEVPLGGLPRSIGGFRGYLFHRIHMGNHVQQLAGISPLVVIPGNDLNEIRVKHDACLGIENGGA
jgi:hypothetical protein